MFTIYYYTIQFLLKFSTNGYFKFTSVFIFYRMHIFILLTFEFFHDLLNNRPYIIVKSCQQHLVNGFYTFTKLILHLYKTK